MKVNPSTDVAFAAAGEWDAPSFIDLDALPTGWRGTRHLRRGAEFDTRNYVTKDEFMSKVEAGELVGLSAKTIEREISRHNLRAFKLAGRVRIRSTDLAEWIDKNRIQPSAHDI